MKAFLRVVWHPLRYLLRFAWFRRFAPVWLVATLLLGRHGGTAEPHRLAGCGYRVE
jgi:hypothetical protein